MTLKNAEDIYKILSKRSLARMSAMDKKLFREVTQQIRYAKRRRNPVEKAVKIYGRVLRMEAQKIGAHRCDAECRSTKHCYYHDFKAGAVAYGLPDGTVLLKSKNGKRLWGMF